MLKPGVSDFNTVAKVKALKPCEGVGEVLKPGIGDLVAPGKVKASKLCEEGEI